MNKTGVVRESEGLRAGGAESERSGCGAGAVLIRLLQTMGNFLAPRLQSQFMLLIGLGSPPLPHSCRSLRVHWPSMQPGE